MRYTYCILLLGMALTACIPSEKPEPEAGPTSEAPPSIPRQMLDVFEASRVGDMARLRELIAADSTIVTNLQPRYNRTALHVAVSENQKEAARFLLDSNADIEALDRSRRTPLSIAVALKSEDMAVMLLERGAATGETKREKEKLLRDVVRVGHTRVLELLFNKGLDANTRIGLNNMLNTAASKGHLAMIRLMLKHQCPINDRGNSGTTPLQAAAKAGQLEAVELLLKSGADIDGCNYPGTTPLIDAVIGKHEDIAIHLVEKGARFQPSKHGRNVLHLAASNGFCRLIELLIEKGMDAKAVGSRNMTALHAAAKGGQREAARLLVERGVEVDALDRNNNSALVLASESGNEKLVTFLLQCGADPNIANRLGATPLHYAALNNSVGMARELLKRGASTAARLNEDVQITTGTDFINPFARGKAVGGQAPADIARNAQLKRLLSKGTATPGAVSRPVGLPTTAARPTPTEPAGAAIPASFVGRPVSEVKKILGKPKMTGKRNGKVMLLYNGRKITSADGITVDSDTRR